MPEQSLATTERYQTRGEEIANTVSHGVGLVAALVAAPILIVNAVRHGGGFVIVGTSIFAATLVLLYLTSTLYHALPRGPAKRVFQILDHSAIFLLIAGTYTPFTLGILHGPWGWSLFGVAWGLAALGVVLKVTRGVRHPVLSLVLYIGMGWLAVVAIRPLWVLLPGWGFALLLTGGLAYTGGVAFFRLERVRYAHLVWHLFVLAGSACHIVAVLKYAA